MNARCRAPAPAVAALVAAAALASPARAAERACPAPTVDADSAFVERFPELLEQVRGELAAQADVDACARVELRALDAEVDAIQVSVSLPDGRMATRSAAERDDVLPTLQALLLVPATSTLATPSKPVAPRPRARRSQVEPAPAQRDAAPPETGPRSLGIELSLLGGARMGEGQVAVGVGARSLLEVYGFLFGFGGRTDRYQMLVSGDPEMGLELGLLAGKRFHFSSFALDLLGGPAVAMKGLAFSETEVARVDANAPSMPPLEPPVATPHDPSTGPVPRLLLGVHAGFNPRSVVRSFVGMEASIGPERVDENPNPDAARFPVLALGLVVGGTLGTR